MRLGGHAAEPVTRGFSCVNHLAPTTGRLRGPLLCAAMIMALGACAQHPRPGVPPALVQQIDNGQQVDDVIGALKLGDVDRARKLLTTMARRDPADRSVATLLEGLDGDPLKLLGSVAFSYRVEGAEQLTALSQRFLGSRLKFYLLARYNGLTSDALKSGQILRIPGVAPSPMPRADTRPEPRPAAIPAARARRAAASPVATSDAAAAGRLRVQALAALNSGAVANAVGLLRRAHSLAPSSMPIQRDLARAERLLAAVKARR